LIWLFVAIFAQVPLILLLSSNRPGLGFVALHTSSLFSMAICVTRIYRGLSMVHDCQCTITCMNIGTIGPTGVLPMTFASHHLPDSRPSSMQTRATEAIATSVKEENRGDEDADEATPLDSKFPTITAPRGHDAV